MRKITLIFAALLVVSNAFCQLQLDENSNTDIYRDSDGTCNIGNEVDPGWDPGNFAPNFLLGISFTLEEPGTLSSINIVGNDSGALAQMAVYDDAFDGPNDLVASSGTNTMVSGIVTFPVTETLLPPGDYWVMAVYNITGDHSNADFNSTDVPIYYASHTFGDPMPENASDFGLYYAGGLLYFLDIECELGVNDNISNLASIYPNPANDIVNLSLPTSIEIEKATLFNLLGKDVGVTITNNTLDVSDLSVGVYILSIQTSEGTITKRIIKN